LLIHAWAAIRSFFCGMKGKRKEKEKEGAFLGAHSC
jgi:hypothetical protein